MLWTGAWEQREGDSEGDNEGGSGQMRGRGALQGGREAGWRNAVGSMEGGQCCLRNVVREGAVGCARGAMEGGRLGRWYGRPPIRRLVGCCGCDDRCGFRMLVQSAALLSASVSAGGVSGDDGCAFLMAMMECKWGTVRME